MSDLRILDRTELRRPILIAAWAGWNDAGEAATSAVRFMRRRWRARAVAEVEAEEFYDFTQARPRVRLDQGERVIDWPQNVLYTHRPEQGDSDLLILSGIEPHLEWHRYAEALLEACRHFQVEAVVTLGALLSEASHRRPVEVSGSSADPALRERLSLPAPAIPGYEGPTGIVGVINDAAGRAGLPTASLWGNIPYYVNASPNPKGSLALLQQLNTSLGLDLRLHDLEVFVARFEAQVQEEIDRNPAVAGLAEQIEQAGELDPSGPAGDGAELPDAQSMVDDLERFLRDQRTDDA